MEFTDLVIKNFMSVRDVRISLNNRGLVLVQGENKDETAFDSNGAGKSTVFCEAPAYAIFGETIRGLKGDEIINENVGKNTEVSIEIDDESGNLFRIERYRKHRQYQNHVVLYKNGKDITAKSDTDTNRLIQDILQIDYLSFINSVIFGQGMSKMFSSSTDAEQKKILERILQIDIFKKCQDVAKQHVTGITDKRRDVSNKILSGKNSIRDLENIIRDLEYRELELKKTVKEKIDLLKSEVSRYELQIQDINKKEIEDVSLLEDEKSVVKQKLEGYKEYEDSLSDLQSDAKLNLKQVATIDKQLDALDVDITQISSGDVEEKVCDKCGQPLPVDNLQDVLDHLQEERSKLVSDKASILEDLSNTESLIDKVKLLLKNKIVWQEKCDSLVKQIAEVNSRNKHVKDKKEELARLVNRTNQQINELEESLKATYQEMITKNKEKVAVHNENIGNLEKELSKLDTDHELYSFWVNGFSNQGIKSILLDSVTPYLNQRANYYLSKLADSSIETLFNTQTKLKSGEIRDKFSVDVKNRYGGSSYSGNSGGEKRRIDLSVVLALHDLVSSRSNTRINMVLYDEIFDSLDPIGCERIITLLKEMTRTKSSIFVITHNEVLKSYFDNIITVEKRNGETRVLNEK